MGISYWSLSSTKPSCQGTKTQAPPLRLWYFQRPAEAQHDRTSLGTCLCGIFAVILEEKVEPLLRHDKVASSTEGVSGVVGKHPGDTGIVADLPLIIAHQANLRELVYGLSSGRAWPSPHSIVNAWPGVTCCSRMIRLEPCASQSVWRFALGPSLVPSYRREEYQNSQKKLPTLHSGLLPHERRPEIGRGTLRTSPVEIVVIAPS